jgi:predicted lipid-binding transport protein (Tim44 family)
LDIDFYLQEIQMKQALKFLQSPSKVTASIFTAVMAVALLVAVPEADAKRMGGGRSVGKSSQTTQKDAAPANNAASNTTSPAAAPAAAAKAPAAAPAPASNRSKWLGPLAGLAAGLGLAALASHFGFGEGLANIMMIALFAMVAFAAFRFFMARRAANAGGARSGTPAFAGAYAGNANNNATAYQAASAQTATPAGYSGSTGAYTGGIGSALADGGLQSIPGFDDAGFVRQAKVYFVRLQAAYDTADQKDLREFTSPEMFAELMMEVRERNGAANRTEVEKLDAELLGQGQDGTHQHVSVRFHGSVKEFEGTSTQADAQPINETWNFAKPLDGSEGWTLVGIEQNA